MSGELKPCPFCRKPLFIRESVNAYGRCDTPGCWMHERKMTVPLGDRDQVAAWNTRAELSSLRGEADVIGRLVEASQKLDKAIDDFLADLRERARWSKLNVDEDGTVTLPCGAGVLYRLGEAREQVGNALALASLPDTVLPRPRRKASPSEVKTGRQGIGEV